MNSDMKPKTLQFDEAKLSGEQPQILESSRGYNEINN